MMEWLFKWGVFWHFAGPIIGDIVLVVMLIGLACLLALSKIQEWWHKRK